MNESRFVKNKVKDRLKKEGELSQLSKRGKPTLLGEKKRKTIN